MLLVPIGGALLGSTLAAGTAYASTAMAAGWLIGSWVMNQFVDEKNDIIDPGEEEMPRINNALRGANIPLLFGTNKVPAHIVAALNYQVIRRESTTGGGKGKPGGSGGGKVPEQTTRSYEYKYDTVYHLGMADEGFGLFSMWIGPDRLDDDIIGAIYSGSGTASVLGALTNPNGQGPTLEFEDSFYYGGEQIDDTWAYLNGELGHTLRFPWTVWVGFKALDLGPVPRLPQIQTEVGPIAGGDDFSPVSGSMVVDVRTGTAQQDHMAPGPYKCDKFGQCYSLYLNGFSIDGEITCTDLDTGNEIGTLSDNDLSVAVHETNVLGWNDLRDDPFFHGSNTDIYAIGLDASGTYLLIYFTTGAGNGASQNYSCYAVMELQDGVFPGTWIGGYRSDLLTFQAFQGATTMPFLPVNRGGTDDWLALMGMGGWTAIYPSIDDVINDTYANNEHPDISDDPLVKNHKVPAWQTRPHASAQDTNDAWRGQTYQFSNANPRMDLFMTHGSQYYRFFNKSHAEKHADNPSSSLNWTWFETAVEPSNDSGVLLRGDWGITDYADRTTPVIQDESTVPTVVSANVVDELGSPVIPFSDDGLDRFGTIEQENGYNTGGPIRWLNDTDAVILLPYTFDSVADNAGTPRVKYGKFRAFLYNTITGIFTQFVNTDPILLYTSDNVPDSVATNDIWYESQISVHWDPNTFDLYWITATIGNVNAINGSQDRIHAGPIGNFTPLIGADLTPAEIIRRLLQDTVFGRGLDNTIVDQTTFSVANAYCISNGFLVSTQYRTDRPILDMISELLAVYDGYLYVSDGMIKFGVRELTLTPVRTLDNDHFVSEPGEEPVTITKGAKQDTYNKIKVNFISRDLEYEQDHVEIGDEVDQDLNGVRMREFPPQFVMKKSIAAIIAERALWSNLYARDAYQFTLGWKDADLEPGDVVTLIDSVSNLSVDARITEWAERARGKFETKAVQEFNYINASSRSNVIVSSPSGGTVFGGTGLPIYQTAYEVPKELYTDGIPKVYVSYIAEKTPAGATLYISPDGASYSPLKTEQPYPLGGTILQLLPDDAGVLEDVEIALFPVDQSTNPSSFWRNETLADISAAQRAAGGSLIWAGSEMMAYEDVNLVSQNRYRLGKLYRGWGGTNIQAHSAGNYWTRHGTGIFAQPFNDSQIGETFFYKVVPFDFSGNRVDITSVPAQSYTIQGTCFVPQVMPTPSFVHDSIDYRGQKTVFVNSTIDIPVLWEDSARTTGYGMRGYGLGGFGDFTQDTPANSWRVIVTGSGDVDVRSAVVTTPAFTYTSSENFEDNGAWRGNPGFTITPFNSFGDGLRSEILSLDLWT